jgi:hypothetical protein
MYTWFWSLQPSGLEDQTFHSTGFKLPDRLLQGAQHLKKWKSDGRLPRQIMISSTCNFSGPFSRIMCLSLSCSWVPTFECTPNCNHWLCNGSNNFLLLISICCLLSKKKENKKMIDYRSFGESHIIYKQFSGWEKLLPMSFSHIHKKCHPSEESRRICSARIQALASYYINSHVLS